MLGGGPQARRLDEVDGIRVPGIRGQLRFWWRALFAGAASSIADLFTRESALWGGIDAPHDQVIASRVVTTQVWHQGPE
jgi:CRISPR-associated protein Cmr1